MSIEAMSTAAAPVRIDPRLESEIRAAESEQINVEAVFALRSAEPGKKRPGPEETKRLAEQAIRRAVESSGAAPQKVNIFENLGSIFVLAAPAFMNVFLEQPEIAVASSNRAGK